ncbi:hypothetical protein [Marinobacter aromaticivorans]|uniref:Uncharacterized protein n=1 Tax=Marinobacter aromaticivorans TaxID=1494078 RepID=A0ABW2IYW0_9GAMM|nr:hypothetical protein [Marinobacter aromaticivorans]
MLDATTPADLRICEGLSLQLYRSHNGASNPSRYGLLTRARRHGHRGGKVGILRPMLLAFFTGTLSPSFKWRHYQLYRLLIALQLALAHTPVYISTTSHLGI